MVCIPEGRNVNQQLAPGSGNNLDWGPNTSCPHILDHLPTEFSLSQHFSRYFTNLGRQPLNTGLGSDYWEANICSGTGGMRLSPRLTLFRQFIMIMPFLNKLRLLINTEQSEFLQEILHVVTNYLHTKYLYTEY